MNSYTQKYYDIVVAKEYETNVNGAPEKKIVWNRVGRAWPSKSSDSLNFELYLIPGQRYFISMKEPQNISTDFNSSEETQP